MSLPFTLRPDGARLVVHGEHRYTAYPPDPEQLRFREWELHRDGRRKPTFEMSWADVCSRIQGDR